MIQVINSSAPKSKKVLTEEEQLKQSVRFLLLSVFNKIFGQYSEVPNNFPSPIVNYKDFFQPPALIQTPSSYSNPHLLIFQHVEGINLHFAPDMSQKWTSITFNNGQHGHFGWNCQANDINININIRISPTIPSPHLLNFHIFPTLPIIPAPHLLNV